MGRNSGSIRGGGLKVSRGVKTGATEKGYSKQLATAILAEEGRIRNNSYESLRAFDEDGNLVYATSNGAKYSVRFDGRKTTDMIVTHNHPRSLGRTGVRSIGNSFSPQDVINTVGWDAKEIRAVTPRYTYSMKRPATGWNATAAQTKAAYSRAKAAVTRSDNKFLSNYKGDWNTAAERLSATYYHRVSKRVAKEMGWDYTWQKNN